MAWIAITEQDVQTRLTGPELSAMKSAALAQGQSGILAEVIEQVVDEVRGYVAAHAANQLGASQTIPQKLLSASLAIIRYRLATRLPVKSLLTEDRVKENDAAIALLQRAADGKFAVEEPVTLDTETTGAPSPRITPKTLNFSDQDGL
jgi:phage gp36-like protein